MTCSNCYVATHATADCDNPYAAEDAARGRPFDYVLDDPNRDRLDV